MARHLLVLLFAVVLVPACSSYTIPPYGLSAENIATLRTAKQRVNVGGFNATPPGRTEISCRGRGPVRTPDGRPFEDYVRRALVDELRAADMFSDSAPLTLTGSLDKIDFSSMRGDWTMDLTVRSSRGRSLNVSSTYDFKTGPAFTVALWGGQSAADERACTETAQAFARAVQVLIGKVVHHREFATLLE